MLPDTSDFAHIHHYWDALHRMPAVKILPGQYYVTDRDEIITTVLGSCVAACIRDPQVGVGGMNHFMLPEAYGEVWVDSNDRNSYTTRYGNYAMAHMINKIVYCGGLRQRLEVKIFGGGKIIGAISDIGQRNLAFVFAYLRNEGLTVTGQDVGDAYSRKVVYFPASGRVRVKKLKTDSLILPSSISDQ